MLKLMITAASSNSGKTAVSCGLLSLLKRRGFDPCAFKCGPDYIDPMFHRTVLGIPSRNLDVFLAGEEGVKASFARGCAGHGAAVCEGVMGYYDGITGSSATASAWHVGRLLDLPAVLVLRPKGAALTLAAVIKGMAEFRAPSGICGVILNDCSEMYYRTYGPVIESACRIPVLGYLPHMEEAVFESRHLGLMTAEEIRDLEDRIDRIGARMEETLDLDRLLEAAGAADLAGKETEAGIAAAAGEAAVGIPRQVESAVRVDHPDQIRIAVARDAAFNFIYAQSIEALEDAGAQIAYFSPLKDQALPENISGLYLPGGYPELYGKQLSENAAMREAIREAVIGSEAAGELPVIAECGGFLYLSETLEDADFNLWPMAGALPGHAAGTGKLVRFGYGHIGCDQDSMLFRAGEQIPVHEFHYWDTTDPGKDLMLTKHSNGKQWSFGYATETLYAGFPHLYLAGRCAGAADDADGAEKESGLEREGSGVKAGTGYPAQTLAARFVQAARQYAAKQAARSAAGFEDADAAGQADRSAADAED